MDSLKRVEYHHFNVKLAPASFAVTPQITVDQGAEARGEPQMEQHRSSLAIKMPRIIAATDDFTIAFGLLKHRGELSVVETVQTEERIISIATFRAPVHWFFCRVHSLKGNLAQRLLEGLLDVVCVATESKLLLFSRKGRVLRTILLPGVVELLKVTVLMPLPAAYSVTISSQKPVALCAVFGITSKAFYAIDCQTGRLVFEHSACTSSTTDLHGFALCPMGQSYLVAALAFENRSGLYGILLEFVSGDLKLVRTFDVDTFGLRVSSISNLTSSRESCSFVYGTSTGEVATVSFSLSHAAVSWSLKLPSVDNRKRALSAKTLVAPVFSDAPEEELKSVDFCAFTEAGGLFGFSARDKVSLTFQKEARLEGASACSAVSLLCGKVFLALIVTEFGALVGFQAKQTSSKSDSERAALPTSAGKALQVEEIQKSDSDLHEGREPLGVSVWERLLGIPRDGGASGDAQGLQAFEHTKRDTGRKAPWQVFKAASSEKAADKASEITPEAFLRKVNSSAATELSPLKNVQSSQMKREMQRPHIERRIAELEEAIKDIRLLVETEQSLELERNSANFGANHFELELALFTPPKGAKVKSSLTRKCDESGRAYFSLDIETKKQGRFCLSKVVLQTEFACRVELERGASVWVNMAAESTPASQQASCYRGTFVLTTAEKLEETVISFNLFPFNVGFDTAEMGGSNALIEAAVYLAPAESPSTSLVSGVLLQESLRHLCLYSPADGTERVDLDGCAVLVFEDLDFTRVSYDAYFSQILYDWPPKASNLPQLESSGDHKNFLYKHSVLKCLLIISVRASLNKIVAISSDWHALDVMQSTMEKYSLLNEWPASSFNLDLQLGPNLASNQILRPYLEIMQSYREAQKANLWEAFSEAFMQTAQADETLMPFFSGLPTFSSARVDTDVNKPSAGKEFGLSRLSKYLSSGSPQDLLLNNDWVPSAKRSNAPLPDLTSLSFELASSLHVNYKYIGHEQAISTTLDLVHAAFSKALGNPTCTSDYESFCSVFAALVDP